MALHRITHLVGAGIEQLPQHHAGVEAGAADQEVVGGPFAALVLSPCLPKPLQVGFEAAGGDDAGAGFDSPAGGMGGAKDAVHDLEPRDRGVVADLHAERFGAAVVGIEQRLAAAQEEGVGAAQVQRARQRTLEAHAVPAHPAPAQRRFADREPCQCLVGDPAGDLEQVLPVLLFRIGLGQHVLRLIMHAAQVAGMHRVAAAPFARCRFQHQHAGAGLARGERRAQRRIAAADDEDVKHRTYPPSR